MLLGHVESVPEVVEAVVGSEGLEVDEVGAVVVDQGVEAHTRGPG